MGFTIEVFWVLRRRGYAKRKCLLVFIETEGERSGYPHKTRKISKKERV